MPAEGLEKTYRRSHKRTVESNDPSGDVTMPIAVGQQEKHTTGNHAPILVELDDMNFAHMTGKSSSSYPSRNIPQENGAITS